jgi:hypothetical protein
MKMVVVLVLMSVTSLGIAQSTGTFTPTGDLNVPRNFHTATLLANGKVLIVGGAIVSRVGDLEPLLSAELYDPQRGVFSLTGKLNAPIGAPTATLLNDGRVLIVGSDASRKCSPNIAEVYDPVTETFSKTGGTVTRQIGGWAIRLQDGRVLVAGGTLDCNAWQTPIANPEIYDPATGAFTATGPFVPIQSNYYFTGGPDVAGISLLADGRVLIAGELNSELFDPVTNTFSLTSSMTVGCWGGQDPPLYLAGRTTTALADGRTLLTGGEHEDCGRYEKAELYDSRTEKFNAIADMTRQRDNHSATLLPDRTVLIAGGESTACDPRGCNFGGAFAGTTTSVEFYDPITGTFAVIGNMTFPRSGHTATLLPNGTVLLAGGYGFAGIGMYSGTFSSAEVYTPPVPIPGPGAAAARIDRTNVSPGDSFTAIFTGSNLNSETFFDVQFTAPGSNQSRVSLNWQTGLTASHSVPAGTTSGLWVITGVRAHRFETDHSGSFQSVIADISVNPQ